MSHWVLAILFLSFISLFQEVLTALYNWWSLGAMPWQLLFHPLIISTIVYVVLSLIYFYLNHVGSIPFSVGVWLTVFCSRSSPQDGIQYWIGKYRDGTDTLAGHYYHNYSNYPYHEVEKQTFGDQMPVLLDCSWDYKCYELDKLPLSDCSGEF